MNRSDSLIARASHIMKDKNDQKRKDRVHKLIQRGGLLNLSGLPQQCGVEETDDLQNSIEGLENAATILGILIDAVDKLSHNNDTQQMEKFKKIGTRRLKQTAAKYY